MNIKKEHITLYELTTDEVKEAVALFIELKARLPRGSVNPTNIEVDATFAKYIHNETRS